MTSFKGQVRLHRGAPSTDFGFKRSIIILYTDGSKLQQSDREVFFLFEFEKRKYISSTERLPAYEMETMNISQNI
jgi:hypothetical protein